MAFHKSYNFLDTDHNGQENVFNIIFEEKKQDLDL
jgi:hypothetical protein